MSRFIRKVTPITYSSQLINHSYVADVIRDFYKGDQVLNKAISEGPLILKFEGKELEAMYALDYYFRNSLLDKPGYLDINYYSITTPFENVDKNLYLRVWADKKIDRPPFVNVIMERPPLDKVYMERYFKNPCRIEDVIDKK